MPSIKKYFFSDRTRQVLSVVLAGCFFSQQTVQAAGGSTAPTPLPSGGSYAAGSGSITSSGNAVTINQSTLRGIIDWSTFSIGPSGSVIFKNGNGATLNEVQGNQMSSILGSLFASGSVYLINPQGVLIGPGAHVDTGGDFLASTLNLSSESNSLLLRGDSKNIVVNLGKIYSKDGSIFLVAHDVKNSGSLHAANGTAGLAAGGEVLLKDSTGDQRVFVKAPGGDVTNIGTISAAQVELKAKGGNIYALAGNNGGNISATGTATVGGHVWIVSDGGATQVTGAVSARNADGRGGDIETSGHNLDIDGAAVKTGQNGNWLLDPVDLTVDSAAASTIESSLATTNVSLQTTASSASGPGNQNASGVGDININSPISWSANTNLTLDAYHGVNVNSAITSTGSSAGLTIKTNDGGSGGYFTVNSPVSLATTGSLTINTTPYTLINTAGALQGVSSSGNYALASDIALTGSYTPINTFSGSLEGLGHTVSGLNINEPSTSNLGLIKTLSGRVENLNISGTIAGQIYAGILAAISSGSVYNVATSGSVSGDSNVGGLIGQNSGNVTNSSSSAAVSGPGGLTGTYMGGLIGDHLSGSVTGSSSSGNVTVGYGSGYVGGFIGQATAGSIASSHSTGNVTFGSSSTQIGGFIGKQVPTLTITDSYEMGSLNGGSSVFNSAGFVGENDGGPVTNSFAMGNISVGSGSTGIGGFAGLNLGTVSNCYARGSVTAPAGSIIGGFAGQSIPALEEVYSTGAVSASGGSQIGGLVGNAGTAAVASYWDKTTSGQSTSATGTGLTTQQWLTQGPAARNASGWDFTNTWVSGYPYPVLRASPYVVGSLTAGGARTYGSSSDPSITLSSAIDQSGNNAMSLITGTLVPVTEAQMQGVGTYNIGGTNQIAPGHQLTYNGTLVINPAILTLIGVSANNKVYDGTTVATLNIGSVGVSGLIGSDTVTVNESSPSGTFANKNAGNGKTVTITGFSLSGDDAANYTLNTTSLTANITPATLIVGGTAVASNKTYDGTLSDTVTGSTIDGVIGGDVVDFSQSGAFANKNAGTGKTVTYTNNITGADAGNYILSSNGGTLTANIDPATLTVGGTLNGNKVYDGATADSISGGALIGVISGDVVNLSQSGTFANKNAGTDKTVTYTNSLSGADAGNYVLASTGGTLSANIDPATLTVGGTLNGNKVYDGTVADSISGGSLMGVIGDDVVSLSQSGTFANKNAGTGKTVTYTNSLSGADASNYVLSTTGGTLTADITPATLTVGGTSVAANKTYDGTLTDTVTGGTLSGVIGRDVVNLSQSGMFANKNAGTDKTVTYTNSIGGPDAGNYVLSSTGGNLTASISPATLYYTVTSVGGDTTRPFGAANPTFSGTVTGLVGGDTLASIASGSASFSSNATVSSGVGTYAITGGGLTLTTPNYTLAQAAGNASAFTIEPITIAIGNATKISGLPNPAFTVSYSGPSSDYLTNLLSSLKLVTNAPTSDAPGTYEITAIVPAALADSILVQPGTLTISPSSSTNVLVNNGSPQVTATIPASMNTQAPPPPQPLPAVNAGGSSSSMNQLIPGNAIGQFQVVITPTASGSFQSGQTNTENLSSASFSETSPDGHSKDNKSTYAAGAQK